MVWFFTKFLGAFLLPPLNLALLAVIGLGLQRTRPRLGRGLILTAVVLLWLLSTPFLANRLLASIEEPPLAAADRAARAIVVLGGGTVQAPEYGGRTVRAPTLQRLRYAANLHRTTGLPVLVTGGDPEGTGSSEGALMKAVLERDFKVPVRWVEAVSEDTRQNASFSARILREAGIRRIYLVTHASHMARARRSFERAGLEVVPAPTGYAETESGLVAFVPSALGLLGSSVYFHEMVGSAWYGVRERLRADGG